MTIYNPTKIPEAVYDSHTHLNDDKLYFDVPAYIGRASEMKVLEMNIVGYDEKSNQRALQIAHDFASEGVRAILGFQPEDSVYFDDDAQKKLADQLADPAVIGVGETGLDWHWPEPGKDVQIASFKRHLELAKQFGLPATIHMRDSFDDIYAILKEMQINNFEMHSFAGTPQQAAKLIDLGGYISFSGLATFKNAHDVHQTVKETPLSRMLVETDAPYLAPVPKRGQVNEPAFTKYVVDDLAAMIGIDRSRLADITTENAHRLWPEK